MPDPKNDEMEKDGNLFAEVYAQTARELAVIQGLMKVLKERDSALRETMRDTGAELRSTGLLPKTSEILVNGTKVGTATLAAAGKDWYVTDEGAFEAWALANGWAAVTETVEFADLTEEQVGLLRLWADANGAPIRRKVNVDAKALGGDLVRLGGSVVYRPTGETVDGLAGCDAPLRPVIRIPKTDVLFGALGGAVSVLPSGDPVEIQPVSVEEVAE